MSLYERHTDELLSDNTHNAGYEQCKDCVYSGKPETAAYSRCICDKYPLSAGNDQWATCKPDGIEDGSKVCQYKQIGIRTMFKPTKGAVYYEFKCKKGGQ